MKNKIDSSVAIYYMDIFGILVQIKSNVLFSSKTLDHIRNILHKILISDFNSISSYEVYLNLAQI